MLDEEDNCLQETKRLKKEIAQAIMILDFSKKPFKQTDIISHLSKKPTKKNWKDAFSEAIKDLNALGLNVIETENTPTPAYFVVSKNRPPSFMYKYASEEETSYMVLLTLVLSFIFMNNGCVLSSDLINHLKNLEIYSDNDSIHPYFGNVKKKIFHDFVDQLYLSSSKITDSDIYELKWGQRAEVEISKRSILEFVCHCGYDDKIKPENLLSQYEKVLEQEGEKSDADVLSIDSGN